MPSIDQIRARAEAHAKQLEAVQWLTVNDLAARWGVSPSTVRTVPREQLGYLTFGKSKERRYDPRDVEAYEAAQKNPASDEEHAA